MKLLTLTINNFGVFSGRHDFDLTPSQADTTNRNLFIVRGHNGAGKSTLFQSIRLALYGRLALGERVSRQAYSSYLVDRIHRGNSDTPSDALDAASVALSFEYIQSGEPLRIWVERRWQRSGVSVIEELEVTKDGLPLDVSSEDYDVWLSDYAPPGLASVIFFDAEQLRALSDVQEQARSLKDSFEQLLGLNFIDRLREDLGYYTQSRTRGQNVSHLRDQVLTLQAEVDAIESQLNEVRANMQLTVKEETSHRVKLEKQQKKLIAEGGRYRALRPELLQRKTQVDKEIETISEEIRDLAAGLLPFVLAPRILKKLSERLNREALVLQRQNAGNLWQEKVEQVEQSLQTSDLWEDIAVSKENRERLIARLTSLLKEQSEEYLVEEKQLIHHLSEMEHKELQAWLIEVQHVIPQQLRVLGNQLKALKVEKDQIDIDLKRVPEEDMLAPIYQQIQQLEEQVEWAARERSSLEGTIKVLDFQLNELSKHKEKAVEELKAAQTTERQLALAERSKSALAAFKDGIIRQQIHKLELELVRNFNLICRKEHLLESAHVDLEDFELYLTGHGGNTLNQNDFSAGEQQLLSLSLLWGLRTLSKRELPLIIDTPLARLDEVHRVQLFENFFPTVSRQVLLFATDAEIDQEVMTVASRKAHRLYRLTFDHAEGQTTVETEEFVSGPQGIYANGIDGNEIPLYISPSRPGHINDGA